MTLPTTSPDESLTRASLHSGQYRADNTGWEGARTPERFNRELAELTSRVRA